MTENSSVFKYALAQTVMQAVWQVQGRRELKKVELVKMCNAFQTVSREYERFRLKAFGMRVQKLNRVKLLNAINSERNISLEL